MFTRCPHCDTYFRITADQLKAAKGDVRCGRCFGTFNGLENLIEDSAVPQQDAAPPAPKIPPPVEPAPAPPPPPKPAAKAAPVKPKAKPAPQSEAPPPSQPVPAARPAPPHKTVPAAKPAAAPQPKAAPPPRAAPKTTPRVESVSFAGSRSDELLQQIENEAEHPPLRLRNFAWVAMALLLSLVLAGQYAYFNRDHLAQKPAARPWLSALCMVLQCEVPLRRSPSLITLVDRHIAADPEHEQSLLVSATFTNDASHSQAFPVLQLTFWDVSNQVIASRRFSPSEYLTGNVDISKGMSPQQSVDIRLRLKDPGKHAVSFEFEFL